MVYPGFFEKIQSGMGQRFPKALSQTFHPEQTGDDKAPFRMCCMGI
jgi:hypothetical protein